MSTNIVVHAKSALSEEVKLSSLAEEAARRLRNTSLRLDNAKRMEILENFCTKMSTSGHKDKFMSRALAKGITNYSKKLDRSRLSMDSKNFLPLYQDAKWKTNQRAKSKAIKKVNWYREENNEGGKSGGTGKGRKKKVFQKDGRVKTETVMFVPHSKGGTLTRTLREREEVLSSITGYRVRYQEAGGNQLANMFSTDMARGEHCGMYDLHCNC